jgi:starch-binding outer membrane protein, SusD/RagB family
VILRTKPSSDGVDVYDYRSSYEAFYDQMISDLETAKSNLPVSWPVTDYSRASKKSAAGLLARVLLTRAYYSTGSDAQAWFTKAKDAALDVINNQATYGVSLYPTYAEVGPSIYGSNRDKNKEAMFVIAYNEANPSSNYSTGANGNRIFKYGLTKYVSRPGMSASYLNQYGWDGNENRLMPTWHFLDLFDETIDARYQANFNEVWIANVNYTWQTGDDTKYVLDPSVLSQPIAAGDTALYFTKNALPYDRKFKKGVFVGRNDLYVNPQHGQPASIAAGTIITQFYPSFKKWINPNKTTTTNYDYGDAMVIRLAEMYLIAAEAYVGLSDQVNAAKYVNVIRSRAALPNKVTDMQVAPAAVDINFILDERARELAGEQQRWYDLKRVFHDQTAWMNYIQKWNPDITLIKPTHWVRPIPQVELDAILNASEFGQNPGY